MAQSSLAETRCGEALLEPATMSRGEGDLAGIVPAGGWFVSSHSMRIASSEINYPGCRASRRIFATLPIGDTVERMRHQQLLVGRLRESGGNWETTAGHQTGLGVSWIQMCIRLGTSRFVMVRGLDSADSPGDLYVRVLWGYRFAACGWVYAGSGQLASQTGASGCLARRCRRGVVPVSLRMSCKNPHRRGDTSAGRPCTPFCAQPR